MFICRRARGGDAPSQPPPPLFEDFVGEEMNPGGVQGRFGSIQHGHARRARSGWDGETGDTVRRHEAGL